MSKKLLIVESPAKAKTINQYLGSDFVVKASYGHVRDLPSKELAIDVDKNYDVKYVTIPKAKKVLTELKDSLDKASELYIATDLDREGEAIAWHLVTALKPKKPVHRITFNEITKSAVDNAVKHPREISEDLVDAQQARRILDRLFGYKLSPFLWEKVYRGLSAGRVQSVAVRLIVEREKEIKDFKSREYWTIDALLEAKKGKFEAYLSDLKSTQKLELKNKAEADKVMKNLKNLKIKVDSIETTPSSLNPSPPLITSSLQQLAARILSSSAKRTMKLAQDLYEGVEIPGKGTVALITYMRTDSYQLSQDAIKQIRTEVGKDYGEKYLPKEPNQYAKKVRGAQEAHEAIRPTHFNITPKELVGKISKDYQRLYQLIYNAALASQMEKAQVETTTAIAKAGDKYRLIGRGRELKFDGFLKVFPDSEEKFVPLPKMEESEALKVNKIEPTQHFTEPPGRYSEASLVKELERLGIGRPSTYAPIMSTIVDRGYVTKKLGRFYPEDVAEVVTDLLVTHFSDVVDYNFTAELEDELDAIADGEKELVPVVDHFYKPFAKTLKEKEKTVDKKKLVEEKTNKTCPECKKPMVIKLGRHGKFYACSGYPKCKYTAPLLDEFDKEEKKEIKEQIEEKCPKCKGDLQLREGKFGTFVGCSNYPKCDYTQTIIIKADIKCPNCGGDLVRKNSRRGRVFWGCANYPKCKTAFWNEPSDKKCPKCSNIMVKKATSLACSQCEYEEPSEEAPNEAK